MRPLTFLLGLFLTAAGARNVWHGHAWAIPVLVFGVSCIGLLIALPAKKRSW